MDEETQDERGQVEEETEDLEPTDEDAEDVTGGRGFDTFHEGFK